MAAVAVNSFLSLFHVDFALSHTHACRLGTPAPLHENPQHSVALAEGPQELHDFAAKIRVCMHAAFNNGLGTRDLAGPKGLTTEAFVDVIAAMLEGQPIDALVKKYNPDAAALKEIKVSDDIDQEAVSCHVYSSVSASYLYVFCMLYLERHRTSVCGCLRCCDEVRGNKPVVHSLITRMIARVHGCALSPAP